VPNAEIAGTVRMWQWIGDDGATTFSYPNSIPMPRGRGVHGTGPAPGRLPRQAAALTITYLSQELTSDRFDPSETTAWDQNAILAEATPGSMALKATARAGQQVRTTGPLASRHESDRLPRPRLRPV
jgi:hypothetical protein